jgi:uncharacterized membrane protein YozB (DUF420 family)
MSEPSADARGATIGGVPKRAEAPRRMPKWGWYAFLFFSFLSAASAFKFVPPGLIHGFFPSLHDGLPGAWWAFVDEGVRRGADHVAHHIANVGNTLAVHMIFGGLAVLLIPLQVSRMWRRGDRRKHRWLGWALVPVISVAALTTPPISFNMSYPLWSEAGFALGSVAWFIALVMGIYWIVKGDRDRHRRWMVMMAALCFGAVSFRLQLPILRLFFELETVFPYIGWTCWVPNVLVVMWWWQRDAARHAARTMPAPATPAE